MPADKLLKTIPALQGQIDALLEFDCSANDLTNGVVNTAFLLLFRDLIRLFACYNDGIINLLGQFVFCCLSFLYDSFRQPHPLNFFIYLTDKHFPLVFSVLLVVTDTSRRKNPSTISEKYFEMNKKQCKDALDFYKKFLVRMDRVAEFLKVAENVGIDKGDIPDLTRVTR